MQEAPELFKKGQIVKDCGGNHFEVLKVVDPTTIDAQSVATKECFIIPTDELCLVEGLKPR